MAAPRRHSGPLRWNALRGPRRSCHTRPLSMQLSTERILTTHCGSLPRPTPLLDLMKARITGQPYDAASLDEQIRESVGEIVHQQAQNGIDILTDGEQSK